MISRFKILSISAIAVSVVTYCFATQYLVTITINPNGSVMQSGQSWGEALSEHGADAALYGAMYDMNAVYAGDVVSGDIQHNATNISFLIPAGSSVFVNVATSTADGGVVCAEKNVDSSQLINELSVHVPDSKISEIEALFDGFNPQAVEHFEALVCTQLLEYLNTENDEARIDLVQQLIEGKNIQMLWLLADSLNNGTRGVEVNKLLALRYMDVAAQEGAYAAPYYIKHYMADWIQLATAEQDAEALGILEKYIDEENDVNSTSQENIDFTNVHSAMVTVNG
jgi:hypothetical protein